MTGVEVLLIISVLFLATIWIGLIGYVVSRPRGRRALAYLAQKSRDEPVLVANGAALVTNLLVLTELIPVEMSSRTELEIVAGVTFVANLIARHLVKPVEKEEVYDGTYG